MFNAVFEHRIFFARIRIFIFCAFKFGNNKFMWGACSKIEGRKF